MSPKSDTPKTVPIHIPPNQFAAAAQFFGSLFYWVTHFWQPLCFPFLALIGLNAVQLQDWATTARAKVSVVENESQVTFSLMPIAYAAQAQKDSVVVVNGKTFYIDTDFVCYKIRDDNTVLIYDKMSRSGIIITVDDLRKDKLKDILYKSKK